MDKNISDFIHKVENLNDDQIKDMASKRAAKAILTPSERAGQARSKIPEQIAHLLNRIYQDQRKAGRAALAGGLPEKLFRELESFCQEHSTTFVPFDILAHLQDEGMNPTYVLQYAARDILTQANTLKYVAQVGPEAAGQILETLAMQLLHTQKILNLFGWSIDDLKFMARAKIDEQAKAKKQ